MFEICNYKCAKTGNDDARRNIYRVCRNLKTIFSKHSSLWIECPKMNSFKIYTGYFFAVVRMGISETSTYGRKVKSARICRFGNTIPCTFLFLKTSMASQAPSLKNLIWGSDWDVKRFVNYYGLKPHMILLIWG